MAPSSGVRGPRGKRALGQGTAADHVTVRRNNLSVVVHHLRRTGAASRAQIAWDAGLNKATVSSLVAELIDRGLVHETQAQRGAVGRPGLSVELCGERVCGIGAEVGVDYLAVMALGIGGQVVAESRRPIAAAGSPPGPLLDELARLVSATEAQVQRRGGLVVGLTLAVPGVVRSGSGTVCLAPNLGWREVPVVDEVRARLGDAAYPVRVDNDANLAAYSELRERPGVDAEDVLLLTGPVGVGGGVVSRGRLLRGGHGFGGEVGHMPIAPQSRVCGCGRRGCWETVVGLHRLLDLAAESGDWVHEPDRDVEDRLAELVTRAEAGDPRTLAALEEVGGWLGLGAAVLVNVLNPDALVLGGHFATLHRWLVPRVEHELRERVLAPDAGGCVVLVSGPGFGAAVRGGAQTALGAVFADPTLVAS